MKRVKIICFGNLKGNKKKKMIKKKLLPAQPIFFSLLVETNNFSAIYECFCFLFISIGGHKILTWSHDKVPLPPPVNNVIIPSQNDA